MQVSVFSRVELMFYLADAAAIKVGLFIPYWATRRACLQTLQEVTLHRARFPKPVSQYEGLAFWGHNIVVSKGDEWKRIRKITAPAFSEVVTVPSYH